MTEPYTDDLAYVRDELRRLDALLRLEVDRFDGPIDEFGALYVTEAEVRRLLSQEVTDGAGLVERPDRQHLTRRAREIRRRRRASADAGDPVAMDRLMDRFGLEPVERELLLAALAPDVDEKYATVYAYLQDDATRRRPTVGFLLGLLGPGVDQLEGRSRLTPGSTLVDDDLVAVDGDGPFPTREVRLDRRIAAFLLGEDAEGPRLAAAETVTELPTGLDDLELAPDGFDALAGLAERASDPPPSIVAVTGPAGTGKAARVAAIAGERGETLVSLDAARVAPEQFVDVIDRLGREARLTDAAVLLTGVLDDEDMAVAAIERLDGLPLTVYLTGETPPSTAARTAASRHEFIPLEIDRAGYPARRHHWRSREDLPADVDPATIASTFRLTRGAIDDAMAMARASARADGEPVTASHVYDACRAQSSEELGELATRVEPAYGWDDIVLPDETESQLREVADRLTDRGTVYAEWGFAEQSSLGNGLVALFSGPSGTGKTMAAEVVAHHAGLDLYKIDLAAVVSKYVGETESNLGRIFDEAADSDAILLFDEADALFGKRSEIGDAHDRYANIEVDYLLQRVEEHDGSVLLTTNLESNIDDAFLRRIHLRVAFPLPDRRARGAIWRRAFPADTPVGELDYDYIERLDLTGGNIRNVALTAAFYAAADGTEVGMEEVVRAIKRECQKTGMPIQPDRFGEYWDVIDTG